MKPSNLTDQSKFKDFNKFRLFRNSKRPTLEWSKENINKSNNKNVYDVNKFNTGIPTGKVNNITVIDLDIYKNLENNIFIKKYGINFISLFNTLTIKTPNNGYHLYFKYDTDIRTTTSKHNIDVRNDGAYVVGPPSIINNKKYEIVNNNTIKAIPIELKDFLLYNIYNKSLNKISYINKNKNETTQKLTKVKYYIDDRKINNIITNIDSVYLNDYELWLKLSTFCKFFNKKQLWQKVSKRSKKYNYDNNNKIYNNIQLNNKNIFVIDEIFRSNNIDPIQIKYIDIEDNKIEANDIIKININRSKLDDKNNFIFNIIEKYNKKINFIKSDCATGKTYSFKKYLSLTKNKFISIVSRKTLSYKHYNDFNQNGIDCRLYEYNKDKPFNEKESIITTIDSILKFNKNFNYSSYVLFLDEVSSIIKYLLNSDVKFIKNHRVLIYIKFLEIIKNCKYIIGTDADIDDNTINFFNFVDNNKKLIVINEYMHYKNTKSYELKNLDEMIIKMKQEDKFLFCSDSKNACDLVFKKLEDPTIQLITKDTIGLYKNLNLDQYDKIIYSPTIVYGIDSIMKRNTYIYNKEMSISVNNMVQMLCRNRSINNLFFLFNKKRYIEPLYNNIQETKNKMNELDNICHKYFKQIRTYEPFIYDHYIKNLSLMKYKEDHYNTNKYIHFLKILKSRGFILKNNNLRDNKKANLEARNHKKSIIFNPIDFLESNRNRNNFKLDLEEIEKYKDFLKNEKSILQYKLIVQHFILNNEDVETDLLSSNEFSIKLIKTTTAKLFFLKKIKDVLKNKETYEKAINNGSIENIKNEYYNIFRDRRKENLDFNNYMSIDKIRVKIEKNLFGKDIIKSKQKKINKKRFMTYTYNKDYLNKVRKLYFLVESKIEEENDKFSIEPGFID